MAEPFLSEIRLVSFNYPPKGWAFTNGQLLPINQNQALFSLLGTTFGGDGRVNFGLPDFRGRTPMHVGNGHTLGERAGEMGHTLSVQEIPQHTHFVSAIDAPATPVPTNNPTNNYFANTQPNFLYTSSTNNKVALNAGTVSSVGGSQAHYNMQPFLAISFCIALQGIFPSPN
ncbi:tail fiber protein [Dyadobacter sp. CY261]|uniref:phage tail protein n=1 Tax=Dyadobacter sp. CY261 TaxID=2907203 RepID=UPI001F24F1E8|nr:tail fiber protein [Dyadobacter sp. CY261]MCF0070234.1 tail fiber protein [Dyadobacter sp. CY261]